MNSISKRTSLALQRFYVLSRSASKDMIFKMCTFSQIQLRVTFMDSLKGYFKNSESVEIVPNLNTDEDALSQILTPNSI